MEQTQYNSLFSFIWNIATDVLVYAFDKSEYKKIILPIVVARLNNSSIYPVYMADSQREIDYLKEFNQRLISDAVIGQLCVTNQ